MQTISLQFERLMPFVALEQTRNHKLLCHLNVADTLDLCTLNGEVIGLNKLSPYDYVSPRLNDRETYVAVVADAKRQQGDCMCM